MRWMRRCRWSGLLLVAVLLLLFASSTIEPAAADSATERINVTTYRTAATEFPTAESVEQGIENGTIEPTKDVIVGETLVVVIESDRLATSMDNHQGSPTEQFLRTLDGDAELRIIQTNPSPQRNAPAASVGKANTTVYRNGSTVYALIETDTLGFRYPRTDKRLQIQGGEQFAIQFGYNLTGNPIHDTGPSLSLVEFYPFKSTLVTSGYTYAPLSPEWVKLRVRINTAPAESLVAQLTLADTRTITIPITPDETPDRRDVWVDLRGVDPGTEYVLELRHDGEVTDRYTGMIRKPRARVTNERLAEITTEHIVTDDGERVTKEIADHTAVKATVMLSHGGKIQVLNGNCEQVGVKWIEPNNETQVTIPLWNESTPVRSVNHSEYGVIIRSIRHYGAGKALYQGNQARTTINLNRWCQAPAARSTPTPTATTTPPPTTNPQTTTATSVPTTRVTTHRSSTPVHNESSPTESPGQPGFTGLTMLLTLLVIMLVALRRVERSEYPKPESKG